jgi:Acyl-protein synthetase, LuxE
MVQATEALVEALDIVSKLLLDARTWSTGGRVDLAALATLRSDLLAKNHRRHVDSIPAYARLTAELGVAADGGYDGDQLLLSDEWFKGYDPGWPESDLPSLTAWLADVSTVHPAHPAGVTDLATWRSALRADDVFVTVSSGTSGPLSLVPRDRMTLTALRSSSGVRLPWALPAGAFDALLLTPRGMGTGIQSGASGIARAARRSTHDDDPDLASFVAAAVADAQPLVLYGSPVRLARLLSGIEDQLALPPGSCVVTGGGWKGAGDGDVFELLETAAASLALPHERCVDTYSTAELNTVLLSCAARRYHVPPVVEAVIVDEQLRPVPGDGDGRMAVLEPMAMSYPGRLMTSDVVRLRHDSCPCGLQGQTLLAGIARMPGGAARGCGVTDRVDQ